MASQKQDREELNYTTCKGRAKWPHLNEPDMKFSDGGEYNCRLYMPADGFVMLAGEKLTIDEFEAKLEAEFLAAVEDARNEAKTPALKKKVKEATRPFGREHATNKDGGLLWAAEEDPEEFYISAKMKASGVSKRTGKEFTMRPSIFDSGKKPKDITNTAPAIGNGSTLKISGSIARFFNGGNAGITIRLNAAQLFEIKAGGQRDAASCGFDGEDEGGYEHDESNAAATKPAKARESVEMDDNDDSPSDDAGDDDDQG